MNAADVHLATVEDGANMSRQRPKCISTRVTAEEFAVIVEAARQANLTVSDYVRLAALEATGIRSFYTDDDRLLLLHLRDELKTEGFNLTAVLLQLNRDDRFVDAPFKKEILEIQRVIAALCVELSSHAKRPTSHRRAINANGLSSPHR
ncbi:plasmid mobilization protein [Rhizobium terrae]|uniref:plasmid mobilization protein n=1 Tax=Rhizobium terrae TaxID=2171756 RepID=UPI000E3E2DFA|nr:hypothetical protein [Rhizobium terrae]